MAKESFGSSGCRWIPEGKQDAYSHRRQAAHRLQRRTASTAPRGSCWPHVLHPLDHHALLHLRDEQHQRDTHADDGDCMHKQRGEAQQADAGRSVAAPAGGRPAAGKALSGAALRPLPRPCMRCTGRHGCRRPAGKPDRGAPIAPWIVWTRRCSWAWENAVRCDSFHLLLTILLLRALGDGLLSRHLQAACCYVSCTQCTQRQRIERGVERQSFHQWCRCQLEPRRPLRENDTAKPGLSGVIHCSLLQPLERRTQQLRRGPPLALSSREQSSQLAGDSQGALG